MLSMSRITPSNPGPYDFNRDGVLKTVELLKAQNYLGDHPRGMAARVPSSTRSPIALTAWQHYRRFLLRAPAQMLEF